jgi:two-component system secretion response regulator SsrB
MVADAHSLLESAARLEPALAVVDLSLARGESVAWLHELQVRCPTCKTVVLSVHDEPSVRQAALTAGAAGFVLKRALATELLPTVDAVLGRLHCTAQGIDPSDAERAPSGHDP